MVMTVVQVLSAAFLVVWVLAIGWQANNLWRAWQNYRSLRQR
jgi:hypothetical protein